MKRIIRITLVGVLVAIAGALAISAFVNARRPVASQDPTMLSEVESARLAELLRLHTRFGDDVWEGWSAVDLPLVVYNEANVFLLAFPQAPPEGWHTVPGDMPEGGVWERLNGVDFAGLPVYRQSLAPGVTPQAFTVRIGERYAASMSTLEWTRISLADQIESELPGPIALVFPFGLFVGELVDSSEHYMALVAHEGFHAWQAALAPERLAGAERALAAEAAYPWQDETHVAAWEAEVQLLQDGVRSESIAEQREIAIRFLEARSARRAANALSPADILLETEREWLEGGAKYVELNIWRVAAGASSYETVAVLAQDDGFDNYAGYAHHREREIDQLGRTPGSEGETRFYYTGWAQAELLDALSPGWKRAYWNAGVTLEQLLAEAVR